MLLKIPAESDRHHVLPLGLINTGQGKQAVLMPELNSNHDRVLNYLMGRGIHPVVLDYCHRHHVLPLGLINTGQGKQAVLLPVPAPSQRQSGIA